jgi:hypothetical protein
MKKPIINPYLKRKPVTQQLPANQLIPIKKSKSNSVELKNESNDNDSTMTNINNNTIGMNNVTPPMHAIHEVILDRRSNTVTPNRISTSTVAPDRSDASTPNPSSTMTTTPSNTVTPNQSSTVTPYRLNTVGASVTRPTNSYTNTSMVSYVKKVVNNNNKNSDNIQNVKPKLIQKTAKTYLGRLRTREGINFSWILPMMDENYTIGRVYYHGFQLSNNTYHVGDVVHVITNYLNETVRIVSVFQATKSYQGNPYLDGTIQEIQKRGMYKERTHIYMINYSSYTN